MRQVGHIGQGQIKKHQHTLRERSAHCMYRQMAHKKKQLKTSVLMVRISPPLKRTCEQTARRAGLSLSEWCRAVLARAANEGAFAPPKRRKS